MISHVLQHKFRILVVSCGFLIILPALAQQKAADKKQSVAQGGKTDDTAAPDIPASIARIRTARTRIESYVKDIKALQKKATDAFAAIKDKEKPDSQAYKDSAKKLNDENDFSKTAKEKYLEAYSLYDGWVAALKEAIVDGKDKKLEQDAGYKSVAADATNAATKFVDLASGHLKANDRGRRGVAAVFLSLADLGIKTWDLYSKAKTEQRKQSAEYVGGLIQWRAWDKIE